MFKANSERKAAPNWIWIFMFHLYIFMLVLISDYWWHCRETSAHSIFSNTYQNSSSPMAATSQSSHRYFPLSAVRDAVILLTLCCFKPEEGVLFHQQKHVHVSWPTPFFFQAALWTQFLLRTKLSQPERPLDQSGSKCADLDQFSGPSDHLFTGIFSDQRRGEREELTLHATYIIHTRGLIPAKIIRILPVYYEKCSLYCHSLKAAVAAKKNLWNISFFKWSEHYK